MSSKTTTSAGIGLGAVIATIISWELYHSILWAFLHGFCSWFYVLYYHIYLR